MSDDVQVVSVTPDGPGQGGTKAGLHSFPGKPWMDTRLTQNVSVTRRRWQRDYDSVTNAFPNSGIPANNETATASYALHAYASFDTSTAGVPTSLPYTDFFSHGTTGAGDEIFNHTTGVRIGPPNFSGLFPTANCVPAEFVNVKDRMFVTACGQNEGLIYKRTSPTTYNCWVVGVGQPTAAPSLVAYSGTLGSAFAYATAGATSVNSPEPAALLSMPNAATATIDYRQSTGGVITRTTSSVGTAANITGAQTLSITSGSRVVTWSALPVTAPGNYVGFQLVVNGYKMIICAQGNQTNDVGSLAANQMLLAEPYNGITVSSTAAWSIIGSYFTVTVALPASQITGSITWSSNSKYMCPVFVQASSGAGMGPFPDWGTQGPQYAWSWYDADTGHVSNASPVSQAPDPSAANATVVTACDPGSLSYPPAADAVRFKWLLPYRTVTSGGSSLFPLGSLQPTFSDGTWNPRWRGIPCPNQPDPTTAGGKFWNDAFLDSELLSGGTFLAPQFTNSKPSITQGTSVTPLYPKSWTYWDGRVWMVATQDRRTLRYSCDRGQCQFGIPEESWPESNVIPIPARDGEILGFATCGNLMIITTQRYAYYIAGNNETNYRIMRLSSDMYGVGSGQMAELPGATENTGSAVVFLGRDRRVYIMQPGQGPIWISEAIQSLLDTDIGTSAATYGLCAVHLVNAYGRKRVLVRTPTTVYRYDIPSQTWDTGLVNFSGGPASAQAFATAYGQLVPINEVCIYNGELRSWLRDDAPGYSHGDSASGFIEFFPLTFDGEKTFKQLEFIRIYVSDTGVTNPLNPLPFRAEVYVNEQASNYFTGAFLSQQDGTLSLFDGLGAAPVDSSSAAELVIPAGGFTSTNQESGPPLQGFRFRVRILWPVEPVGTPDLEVYRVDFGYKTMSEKTVS